MTTKRSHGLDWEMENRLGWLVILTVSASWLSNYLFDPEGMVLAWPVCVALHAAAWLTVIRACRRYCANQNGALPLCALSVCVIAVFAGMLRTVVAPCQPRPEIRRFQALSAAAAAGDVSQIQAILSTGVNPDYTPQKDMSCNSDQSCYYVHMRTPLCVAAANRHFEAAKLLLYRGASPTSEYQDADPIAAAAKNGDISMLRLLFSNGSAVQKPDSLDFALASAVRHRRQDAVAFLLARGANPNAIGEDNAGFGKTALDIAHAAGDRAIEKMLIAAGGR